MPASEFGGALRAVRLEANLRQQDLATQVGMARSTIANIEAGREPPTARLWAALIETHPSWIPTLRDALDPGRGTAPNTVARPATWDLGGPFVIEQLSYVYVFEHSRSPSEILEVRRVRATRSGAAAFNLKLRHTKSPGFVVEEQSLWGGHLAWTDLVDETGQTAYLRTFEFPAPLKRGERHEFATRTFIEQDPDPQTEISFNLTIPATEVRIHVGFQTDVRPRAMYAFGPRPEVHAGAGGDESARPLAVRGGMASAAFRRPDLGPHYGVGWAWD